MTLIKSLPVTGLNFLGVGGQQVIDTHRQLRNVVTERLGASHGNVFATPKRDGGGDIDWYVPDGVPEAPVRQWTSLAAEERASIRADLEQRLDEIRDKAADLKQSRDERLVKLAERMEKATVFPDDRFIFVVGEQPVIVCWGARSETLDLNATILSKQLGDWTPRGPAARAPYGAAAAVPTAATTTYFLTKAPFPWGTLLSLLAFLVFLAAIARTLVPACGVDGMLAPSSWRNIWCSDVLTASAQRDDETARLERELDALKSGLAAKPCDPPPSQRAEPAPQPPPVPPRRTEDEKKVEDEGGKIGEVNVILRWQSRADLDLHVICPGGQEIYHENRRQCGGVLDVDMNYPPEGRMSSEPVENIVFPAGTAAKGRYQVRIINVTGGNAPYEVIVRIKGQERRISGIATGRHDVTSFDLD